MSSLLHLRRHLRHFCGAHPFSVYVLASRDRRLRLLLASDEVTESASPSPESGTRPAEDRIIVEQHDEDWFLRFFFEDHEQALIVIASLDGAWPVLGPDQLELLWLSCKLVLAEETIRNKKAEWAKLLESIRSISAKLDSDSIIHEIIGNALSVIPAADAGLLHLYDSRIERLVPKATVGFANRVLHDFKLRIGESIAGKVYQDGVPRLYRNHPETEQGMHDISIENYHLLNDAKELANLHGLLCVPISIENSRIGVLVLHQFHENNVFSDYDLTILQGFADQTAIAMQNAQLYADTRKAYESKAALSKQLQAKHDDLIKRNHIHETIKQLSLQNRGTSAIVQELGKMTGKQVLFADWVEQRYYPEHATAALSWDELSMLFTEKWQSVSIDVRTFDSNSEHSYRLYPLRNGSVFLGSLIIRTNYQPLTELDRVTIEQGSAVLTLDLVKKQSLSSVLYKRAHDMFHELITSKGTDLYEQAQSLGLGTQAQYFVVFMYLTSCPDFAKLEASIHRLITTWKWTHGKALVLAYGFHNHVTLLMHSANDVYVQELIKRLRIEAVDWDLQGDSALAIGVGSVYTGLEQIGRSHEEAKKAAQSIRNQNRSGVASYRELGINRLLLSQSQEDIDTFLTDVFGPLRDGTDKHSELEHTLLAYIQSAQSPQLAARELHIHVNTLYQRLRKIEELLQIDLREPKDLLKIQLACHLRQM